MKRQQATIKLALRKETAKDGTHSVVLRVQWQGKRSDLTLPINLNPTDWNEEKQEVRKSTANYKALNVTLNQYRQKAEMIRDKHILSNEVYTAKQIIDELKQGDNTKDKSHTIKSVMEEYFKSAPKLLATNTVNQYKQSVNNFLTFLNNGNVEINTVNKEMCDNWLNYLEICPNINSDNTRRRYAVCIRTLFAFANEREYIKKIPFTYIDRYSLNKRFKRVEHPKALTVIQYNLLDKEFYPYYRLKHGKDFDKNMLKPYSKDFIFNFFLCGCNLQGVAPIDLLKLRKTDIIKRTTKKIIFKVDRTKTGKEVILTLLLNESKTMFSHYLDRINFEGKELLFPLFEGMDLNDNETVTNKMKDFIQCASTNLKKVWKEFNEWLKDRVEKEGEIKAEGLNGIFETIDKVNVSDYYIENNITLYSYRHTYATTYLAKGGNVYQLARDLGRSIANIDEYIDTLPQSQELRDLERDRIMNKELYEIRKKQ